MIQAHPGFASRVLSNQRDVWVYLPPGYHESPQREYPVVYLQDGQNCFDARTAAFGVEWGLDETADHLISTGQLPPLIMVAAGNTPDRLAEYSPLPDPKYGGGKAADYGRFLVEELKPFVDANYRTSKAPEKTAVMGSSMGGLVSLWLGWNHPGVFGLVGALSPSLWWAGKAAMQQIAAMPGGPSKVWLDCGHREGEDRDGNGVVDPVDNLRDLAGRLHGGGFTREHDLFYQEIRDGEHNEASWGRRAGRVLQALFAS